MELCINDVLLHHQSNFNSELTCLIIFNVPMSSCLQTNGMFIQDIDYDIKLIFILLCNNLTFFCIYSVLTIHTFWVLIFY